MIWNRKKIANLEVAGFVTSITSRSDSLSVGDVSGIYAILNMNNCKFYIGSTVNLRNRKRAHFSALKGNRHYCRHLQRSYNLYTGSLFEYRCVECCSEKDLIYREQYWIDKFWKTGYLYNEYNQARRIDCKSIGKEERSRKKFPACIVKDCLSIKNHGRFCSSHWSAYYLGVIDILGNKVRDSKKGKQRYYECAAKKTGVGPCSNTLTGRFCTRHKNQYALGIIDYDGNKLREIKKGAVIYPECVAAKHAGASVCGGQKTGRFCKKHYGQYERGVIDRDGNKLRDLQPGKKTCQK